MKWYISTRARLGLALGAATAVCLGLYLAGAAINHSWLFAYLVWNLFLAWVPLCIMLWLEKILRRKLWSSWPALIATVLFVGFLPNTFYMTTDMIHLMEAPRVDVIFDVIMLSSFIFNAFMLGLISVYMFHVELLRRLSVLKSWALLGVLLLSSSFAVYIGRDLRWNTWDIILNPASVLFEVSDRILSPLAHPELYSTTLGFFVFITSAYVVVWYMTRAARQMKVPD